MPKNQFSTVCVYTFAIASVFINERHGPPLKLELMLLCKAVAVIQWSPATVQACPWTRVWPSENAGSWNPPVKLHPTGNEQGQNYLWAVKQSHNMWTEIYKLESTIADFQLFMIPTSSILDGRPSTAGAVLQTRLPLFCRFRMSYYHLLHFCISKLGKICP